MVEVNAAITHYNKDLNIFQKRALSALFCAFLNCNNIINGIKLENMS
jgi:hypothetical protein